MGERHRFYGGAAREERRGGREREKTSLPIRKFLDCKHSRQRIGRALDSKGNSKLLRLAFLIVPPRLQAFADRQQEREANERETPQGRVFFFFFFFFFFLFGSFFPLLLHLVPGSSSPVETSFRSDRTWALRTSEPQVLQSRGIESQSISLAGYSSSDGCIFQKRGKTRRRRKKKQGQNRPRFL